MHGPRHGELTQPAQRLRSFGAAIATGLSATICIATKPNTRVTASSIYECSLLLASCCPARPSRTEGSRATLPFARGIELGDLHVATAPLQESSGELPQ